MTTAPTPAEDDLDEFAFLAEQAAEQRLPAPVAHREHLTLPDGRTLSAIRYGGGAASCFLLHGAGLNAHTWDTTAIALGTEPTPVTDVVAIDLAGHGDSSWRDDLAYAPQHLADDVIRGIEAWGSPPVVLVGQSLGGLTAASVAASRPDLVARLVLVDVTPAIRESDGIEALIRFYAERDFASRDAVVDRAVAFGLGGAPEQTRRGVFLNTRVRADGRVVWKHHIAQLFADAAEAAASGRTPSDALAATLALSPSAGWADLARVTAPVALVRGTTGFVSPDAAAEFASRLPDATIVEVDAPHNIQEVAFTELAALIRVPDTAAGN